MTDAHDHLQAILNAFRRLYTWDSAEIEEIAPELMTALDDADQWDKETE